MELEREVGKMLKSSSMSLSVRKLTIVGVLGAISAVLGLTPLGFIPIGPTRATIMHIPVIIGAIVEGPVVGMLVGLIFGIFSMIQAIMNPTPVSFVFLNPLVSLLPRVLIGLVAYYSYIVFKKMGRGASVVTLFVIWVSTLIYLIKSFITQLNTEGIGMWQIVLSGLLVLVTLIIGYLAQKKLNYKALEVVISAALGTLTNTVLVLFMIYILYAQQFVEKIGGNTDLAGKVIFGIGIANGIPEVIVAMLIVTGVVMSLRKQH